jgi:CheY-like chemotaxis protein
MHESAQPSPAQPSPAQPSPAQPSLAKRIGPQRRVLIVDIQPDSGRRLAEMLREIGHHAEHVSGADAALSVAAKLKPEVVFLDMALPDFEGPALSQLLRLLLDPQLPRVVAIAQSEEEVRRIAPLAGCEQALLRPLALKDVERQLA